MSARVFDDTCCQLGEGALWHPERQQLFWFDILQKRLLTNVDGTTTTRQFDGMVSAAGWVDRDTLLVASETALLKVDLNGGEEIVAPLEADIAGTRSNDGRADPYGGFWISTMGRQAEPRAGSIWRYYRGEMRRLVTQISIPNAICFAPDASAAYYADTKAHRVMRQGLDDNGWPKGEPQLFIDVAAAGLSPDGAVTDAAGHLWIAEHGASRVSEYDPAGRFVKALTFPASQVTCPAFGGPDLTTLFVTSALQGLSDAERTAELGHGCTFMAEGAGRGRREPRVIL